MFFMDDTLVCKNGLGSVSIVLLVCSKDLPKLAQPGRRSCFKAEELVAQSEAVGEHAWQLKKRVGLASEW